MNQVNLVGNLTADPNFQVSQSNMAVVSFNIGVQKPFKNKKTNEYESDFPRCKAFGKTAEIINEHFKKGSKIALSGAISTGSYEDKDGKRIYTTDVIVNQVTFVERKQAQQDNNSYGNSRMQNNNNSYQNAYGSGQSNQSTGNKQVEENPFSNSAGAMNVEDDDLPF